MSESLDEIRQRCPIEIAQDDCYSQIREAGLDYGPAFRGVSRLWRGEEECLAKIEIPAAIAGDKMAGPLHPAAMDACFHFLGTMGFRQAKSGSQNGQGAFLFVEIAELQAYTWTGQPLWSRVWLTERGRDQTVVNCQVFEETGALVWEGRGLRCQAIGFGDRDSEKAGDGLVYQSRWQVQPLPHRRLERNDRADLVGVELLGREVQSTANELLSAGNLEVRFKAFQTDADQLCVHYALAALVQLGGDFAVGRRFSLGVARSRAARRFPSNADAEALPQLADRSASTGRHVGRRVAGRAAAAAGRASRNVAQFAVSSPGLLRRLEPVAQVRAVIGPGSARRCRPARAHLPRRIAD